jgi:ATP synthase
MQPHIAAPLANVVFEQPVHCVKRVADGDMGILLRVVRLGIASDDDVAARNTQICADPEQIALPAARMLAFDDDAAGYDPFEKAFELLGAWTDARRNPLRAVHVTEAVVESLAAENAARFAAMGSAYDNVSKRLEELRQDARLARQDEITTELLDLVTGAEASQSAKRAAKTERRMALMGIKLPRG